MTRIISQSLIKEPGKFLFQLIQLTVANTNMIPKRELCDKDFKVVIIKMDSVSNYEDS